MRDSVQDFIRDAGVNFVGDGLVVVVVGVAVYWLITRRLERKEEAFREKLKSAKIRRSLLQVLDVELRRNSAVVEGFLEHLPKGALPYSGFEVNGWTFVSQLPAFTTLPSSDTVGAVLDAYLRMRAANEQHALLFDLTYGAAGAMSFLIAGASSPEEAKVANMRLEERRRIVRSRLEKRVEELRKPIETASREVTEELEQLKRQLRRTDDDEGA